MYYNPNWEKAKKHFEAFWNMDYEERCSLSIRVPKSQWTEWKPSRTYTLEERYTDPDYINEITRYYSDNTEHYCEGFASHMLYFGTGGHCEYFGAQPNYADGTIWFTPFLNEPDASAMNFDAAGQERFKKHLTIARRLTELAKDDYCISMPDNCGLMDALAEIRGNENLLIDMLDEPEFIHEAQGKIFEVWKETQKKFRSTLAENNGGGSSIGWMQLWCPGSTVQLQCDFSVMVSPSAFEEFALPELIRSSEVFDHCVYHLDGIEQIRHLDMILSVKGISAIQWTPVAAQPKTSENIEVLQKIQKAGKGLVLFPDAAEVPFLLENLSSKGLHMMIGDVKNREEAEELEKLAIKLAH